MIVAVVWMVTAPALLAGDSLYGTIRSAETYEPVSGVRASVRVSSEAALSDSGGHYVLRVVSAGRLEVRFERLGFAPQSVVVTLAGTGATRVDVDLAPDPVALSPISIMLRDSGGQSSETFDIGTVRLTPVAAERNPLVGESDVFQTVATASAVTGRDEPTPSLRVRGGAGDENLVVVDGLPWRGPRPLGGIAGLLPSSAVTSVDVHTLVPPARFDGGLSSTIVVQPRVTGHFIAEGTLDPSTAEQTLGCPLPLRGMSVLVSGRSTYRSVFNPPEGGESDNGFRDVLGRLSVPVGAGRLDLYYLDSRDRLVFPAATLPATALNHFTSAGSLVGTVWTRSLGKGRRVHARLWSGRLSADAGWGALRVASSLRDVGFSAELVSDRSEAGLAVTETATHYRVRDSISTGVALDGAPVVVTAYAGRRWTPAAAWTVSTGVRLNATSAWGVRIEPRVWTRLELGRTVAVSLAYARVHQYVQSVRNEESVLDVVLGMDLPLAAGANGLPPASAEQLAAAVEARFGGHAKVLVEGYTRRLSGLALVAPATRLPFADGPVLVGRGSVRGIDATLTFQGPRLDARAQLGVLETHRMAGTIRYRPSDDAARGSIGIGYRLSHRSVVRLRAFFGEGRPTTPLQDGLQLDPYAPLDGGGALTGSPIAQNGPLNAARLPPYARVDLGLSTDWELRGRGPRGRLNTALTISNLLNRHNVLAYVAAPSGISPVFLLARTLSLRVRWSFGAPE